MAKEGKKGIGKIVAIVIVVLVVIAAIGGTSNDGSSSTSEGSSQEATEQQTTQEQTDAEDEQDEPYTVTDEELDTSNPYTTYITGTLTNNTDNEVSYIQVEYNLYDADGAQIGTALANTNNLKAGGTWKFEALGTASPDEVASYELVDVTGF